MEIRIAKSLLFVLSVLLILSIVLNLSYPLLWNDEAATAMLTKSTLHYGYPRVIFENNYLTQLPGISLEKLMDQETGASKENGWFSYYIAAPFVLLAEKTSNIFLKTVIIRTPFAVGGIISIFLFAYVGSLFTLSSKTKLSVLLLFIIYAVLNVPLHLHIREARYYSILLLLVSIFWYVLFRYVIFSTLSYRFTTLTLPVIGLAILLTYPPAVFPCIVTLAVSSFCHNGRFHLPTRLSLLPFFASCITAIPFLLFFNVFQLAQLSAKIYQVTPENILINIVNIISILYRDDLLILFIIVVGTVFILFAFIKKTRHIANYLSATFLIAVFSISSIAIFSRLPYLFTRYFIFLGPLLSLFAITGIVAIKETILPLRFDTWRKGVLLFLTVLMVYNLTIHEGQEKTGRIIGHIYELTHQYQGPLDVIIPYILVHLQSPENLIVATNYEEFSYMYYLKSHVIVGYAGINLKEDLQLTPDVIIFRPGWGTNPEIFRSFLRKGSYDEISFHLLNYPLNNIPEFYFTYPHQFQTQNALIEKDKVRIFVRKGSLQS